MPEGPATHPKAPDSRSGGKDSPPHGEEDRAGVDYPGFIDPSGAARGEQPCDAG